MKRTPEAYVLFRASPDFRENSGFALTLPQKALREREQAKGDSGFTALTHFQSSLWGGCGISGFVLTLLQKRPAFRGRYERGPGRGGHATFRMEGIGIRILLTEIMLFLPYASGSIPLLLFTAGCGSMSMFSFPGLGLLHRERLARACSGHVWASFLHEETTNNAQFIMHNLNARCARHKSQFTCTIRIAFCNLGPLMRMNLWNDSWFCFRGQS